MHLSDHAGVHAVEWSRMHTCLATPVVHAHELTGLHMCAVAPGGEATALCIVSIPRGKAFKQVACGATSAHISECMQFSATEQQLPQYRARLCLFDLVVPTAACYVADGFL
jgi:hypothetical protein